MKGFTDAELLSHRKALFSFAYSMSRSYSDSEDLVQETLIKALKNRESFEAGTNLKGWLFRILRNELFSNIRKNKRNVEDVEGFFTKNLIAVDDPLMVIEARQTLKQLRHLPSGMRKALIEISINEKSYEELAESSGVALGTIKSRISRAREMLEAGRYSSTLDEDETSPVADEPEESVNVNWHDTIRKLFMDDELDISEISLKIGLPKIEVLEAVTEMKLKRKKR